MVVIYDSDTNKKPDESELEYVQRMCSTKGINKLSWKGLTELLNDVLGYSYSESYYRKHFNQGDFLNAGIVTETSSSSTTESTYTCAGTNEVDPEDVECNGECKSCDNLVDCLHGWKEELNTEKERVSEATLEMRKERCKLADERAQNSIYVRRLAREETIKEIAYNYAEKMTSKKKLPALAALDWLDDSKCKQEGILLLSDWHYGMVCNNPWNQFDPDICRKRVRKLLDRSIQIVETNSIRKVTVLNLSDLIAGRIHSQIRIESRFDVITQIMEVSEILAEFLNELSGHCEISYYDCLDNHSRLEPNKNDSMDLESLVRIIPWYLRERLVNNNRIRICDNEFGADIITCKVLDHDIIGVHGDNDRPTTALERLSLMTQRHYAMLCTAHLHHFSCDEQHQSVVVSNSSLMGVDRYAEKLRLTSDPSQTFIIATKENVCECIYRIKLN